MNKSLILLISGLACFSGSAMATSVNVGINVGTQAPVVAAPAPVVITPVAIGWHGDRYWDGSRYWDRREWEARQTLS